MRINSYYNEFFEFGQQQMHFNLYEIGLPQDDPVYTLKKVMEELDFTGLIANYSNLGRKGYNPIMMFAILIYANMRSVKAVDQIVELCERDLAFIWLSKGQKPKRDAFYDFIHKSSPNYETLIQRQVSTEDLIEYIRQLNVHVN